jgi:hypothetical protein
MSLENRLAELRNEAEKGRAELETLEQRRQQIYSTLLRISGAIQVLEEMREDHHLEATER